MTPGQTSVQGGEAPTSAEEASDFLARERAALGDDAAQFGNFAAVADAGEDDDDDDLLGGGGGGGGGAGGQTNGNTGGEELDMMGDFEASFPTIDTSNEGVAPGGTITGSQLPYRAPSALEEEADSAPLREWRERRDLQVQHIDERSASKKSETVKAAQEAIDEFYENYNNRKDKQVAQTRKEAEEFLQNREDTTSGGTSWERIAKLVDLSGKGAAGGASGSSKGRMRELLVSLRKDEKAPGASGV